MAGAYDIVSVRTVDTELKVMNKMIYLGCRTEKITKTRK